MITNQLKENMIQGLLFGYYMLSTKFIIIKGWLHCLTSESKRRFLVSNILCMMSGHGPNPIFFNKKRLDAQNSCCTPQPHYVRQGPIFILPLPHPDPPPLPHQAGCHMCIAHNLFPCRLGVYFTEIKNLFGWYLSHIRAWTKILTFKVNTLFKT